MRRVVVTGLGIVSSIGNNADEVTDSLRNARSGIVAAEDYIRLGFRSQVHGSLKINLDEVVDRRARRFQGDGATEVTICCVDTMDVWMALWKQLSPRPDLYIDARMGAEVGKVFCVGQFGSWYEEHLYPSSEAFRAPCTAKATMYCASGLSAFIAAQVANYVSGREVKPEMTVDFRNGLIL